MLKILAICFLFCIFFFFFFFNDTATTEIYTLSLHDALPISPGFIQMFGARFGCVQFTPARSEEHTSELQSRLHLVCRLLLEKKKKKKIKIYIKKKKNKNQYTRQKINKK